MAYVLATDLDGTLLRPDHSVSDETQRALALAPDRDVAVVFVTGRPVRLLAPVVAATGAAPLAVCANGAVTVDLAAGQILSTTFFTPDEVLEVRRIVRQFWGEEAVFGQELAQPGPVAEAGFRHDPDFLSVDWTRRYAALGANGGGDTVKLLARVPSAPRYLGDQKRHDDSWHADMAELFRSATQELSHIATVTHSSRTDQLLELAPHGVTKATSLLTLTESRFPGSTVVAIGDMPNDIPMLTRADISYAVESAHPEALAAADRITADPEHDGVRQVIEALFTD